MDIMGMTLPETISNGFRISDEVEQGKKHKCQKNRQNIF
jgi:hypothetical protein